MKSSINPEIHAAIMASGAAYFAGEKEAAREGLAAVARKLGELGLSSRQVDEERIRRAQLLLARSYCPPEDTRELNRAYLLARDRVALAEDPVGPMDNFYRYSRAELLGIPALAITRHQAA